MSAPPANADQIAYWNDAAGRNWAALQSRLDAQLDPLGRRALAALAPRPGERILDIGCGAGATTLQLAQHVGPAGEALGIDISARLLQIARSRAASPGAGRLAFLQADAQADPLPVPAFDAAFSRFGVMFFADPVAAFRHIAAALRPGARLAFVCWGPEAQNPMFTAARAAGLRHLPPPEPADPHAPGPFAFADPDRVHRILGQAGYAAIEIAPATDPISPGTLEEAVDAAQHIGPLAAWLREHPEHQVAIAEELRRELTPYLDRGTVRFPTAAWIVTAST